MALLARDQSSVFFEIRQRPLWPDDAPALIMPNVWVDAVALFALTVAMRLEIAENRHSPGADLGFHSVC